ncbi:MAG: hypothetical protein ACRD1F_02980 [Terriglobales bacterium]
MIEVFNNPWLVDFIMVCNQMPPDEREQLCALTGEEYNHECAAVGNFTVPGPKWVIKADGQPIVVGGFVPQRPGVYRDFLLTTPQAWTHHWFPVTRICRRLMDEMLRLPECHRLECVALGTRTKAFDWYRVLGYTREGVLRGYCANGADAVIYSRVEH